MTEEAHAITLTGLSANTRYHYRVESEDEAGNLAASADLTFKTAR
jgi:chitodextrinase